MIAFLADYEEDSMWIMIERVAVAGTMPTVRAALLISVILVGAYLVMRAR